MRWWQGSSNRSQQRPATRTTAAHSAIMRANFLPRRDRVWPLGPWQRPRSRDLRSPWWRYKVVPGREERGGPTVWRILLGNRRAMDQVRMLSMWFFGVCFYGSRFISWYLFDCRKRFWSGLCVWPGGSGRGQVCRSTVGWLLDWLIDLCPASSVVGGVFSRLIDWFVECSFVILNSIGSFDWLIDWLTTLLHLIDWLIWKYVTSLCLITGTHVLVERDWGHGFRCTSLVHERNLCVGQAAA